MTDKQSSWTRIALPLCLLATGLILGTMQSVYNAGTYMQTWLIHVDHPATYKFTTYDQLLQKHVKGGLIDYSSLHHDTRLLKQAVNEIKHISPDRISTAEAQLSFWINSYNLLVVQNVVDHYPLSSINDLPETARLREFVVGGKAYSLENIENWEIRPRLTGTNVKALFTICSGARGYPRIGYHALDPTHFQDEIRTATEAFVNNPENVFYDSNTSAFYLSLFFKWNENLLVTDYDSTFSFANDYLNADLRLDLQSNKIKKTYLPSFDWRLNDTPDSDVKG